MFIELIDETEVVKEEYQKLVEDVISFASDYLHYPENRECCISFVSSERIREINRDFRNIDKVTDVISFALDDEDEDMDPIKNFMASDENFVTSIGDIIISVNRAKEQAEEYGHSLERELGFLALHGFLHLNGYDHQTEEEEKEMTDLQTEILTAYGLTRNA